MMVLLLPDSPADDSDDVAVLVFGLSEVGGGETRAPREKLRRCSSGDPAESEMESTPLMAAPPHRTIKGEGLHCGYTAPAFDKYVFGIDMQTLISLCLADVTRASDSDVEEEATSECVSAMVV